MRENLICVKIIIIIEPIELTGMCAKIKPREYASSSLMPENLHVYVYSIAFPSAKPGDN